MYIFTATQIRAWDEYTILHEPIASIDLMERASLACYQWLLKYRNSDSSFVVFCAKGNNGGDGLAIARMLAESEHTVTVYILEFGHKGTEDFQTNLARLHDTTATIKFISAAESIPLINRGEIILDALLGSGLNRPLEGLTAHVVKHINQCGNEIISIDIPSGLFVDGPSNDNTIVQASHTLSFQCYKPAFLVAENAPYIGELHILDIGLHPLFPEDNPAVWRWTDKELLQSFLKVRAPFSHKGTYGHAAILAGSQGMMGAAVLCLRACLRSGVGKLTAHIPSAGNNIVQISVPEAMTYNAGKEYIELAVNLSTYDAVGAGPGWGQHDSHAVLLENICQQSNKGLVLDADALNTLAQHPHLLKQLPANTVITPHPKEFERLFGKADSDFTRIQQAMDKARELQIVIVLKGRYTLIATPGGMAYFNSTGNPGMATGGTGDVLTGIITGLLAQHYTAEQAAILGVYLHGLAGDLAAAYSAPESLIASDLTDHLGDAFLQVKAS